MSSIDPNLLSEGKELIESHDADGLHRFSDRVLTVDPKNWFGLYARGCAYALDADYENMMSNWSGFIDAIDDDSMVADLQPVLSSYYAYCLLHMSINNKLDISKYGNFIGSVNDKLPESKEELFLNDAMDIAIEGLKKGDADYPQAAFYVFGGSVVASFSVYVELPIFIGFFNKLSQMLDIAAKDATPKGIKIMEKNRFFIESMLSAMNWAVDNCSSEELESAEEYWIEHDRNPYLAHVSQAYQMLLISATGGFVLSKIAKKAMRVSARNFIVSYLAPVKKGPNPE